MDPKVFAAQPYKIGGSGKVDILNTLYLDPEYEALCRSDLKATATGLVTLIDIIPKSEKTLPSFILRWDSRCDTVDVDICLHGKNRKDLWNRPGYSGHHTTGTKWPWRRFKVDIAMPERKIFVGTVNIGLLIEVNPTIEIEMIAPGRFTLTHNLPPFDFSKNSNW